MRIVFNEREYILEVPTQEELDITNGVGENERAEFQVFFEFIETHEEIKITLKEFAIQLDIVKHDPGYDVFRKLVKEILL